MKGRAGFRRGTPSGCVEAAGKGILKGGAVQRMPTLSERGAWNALAAGIVMQAMQDYKSALKQVRGRRSDPEIILTMQEIERFFNGRWYRALSDIDGNKVLEHLKKKRRKGRAH